MSGEIEKFTLVYEIDARDPIARLEELAEKFEKAQNKGKKSQSAIKNALSEVGGEMKDLIPHADKAFAAVNKLGKAAPALVILAAGIIAVTKAMRELNKEFQISRQTGFAVGMNPFQIDDYHRQFNMGNGRMTRGGSRELLQKVSGKVMEAYTDPNPWNRQAIALQQAGVRMQTGGAITQTDDAVNAMTKKFKSVSKEQADALGQSIGLTVDETRAIRARNEEQGRNVKQTDSQIARSHQAMLAMDRMNSATGRLKERWDQTSDTLAQTLMPALSAVLTKIEEITRGGPEAFDELLNAIYRTAYGAAEVWKSAMDPENWGSGFADRMDAAEARGRQMADEQIAKQAALAKEQQRAAELTYQSNAQFQKNVNLFAQSVGAFSGVISDQQAWASWAGQIGKEGGISGSGEYRRPDQTSMLPTLPSAPVVAGGTTDYNFGNIRSDSKSFRKYETPEAGMQAQIGLLQRYQSKHGKNTISEIINRWAPPTENKTSDYVKFMSDKMGIGKDEFIDMSNPEVAGKFAYFQAIMEKGHKKLEGYNPQDFVNAAKTPQPRAESRNSARQQMVYENLATSIGVPVAQLQQGGVAKGDVDFGLRQLMFGTQTDLAVAQAKYAGRENMLPAQAAQAKQDLIAAEQAYSILREFGPSALDRSRPGGRERTEGRPDVTFHIQVGSVQNGKDFNEQVVPALTEAAAKIQNLNNSMVIY